MFNFFKRKTQVVSVDKLLSFNECLFRTMDGSVVRCKNIACYFEANDGDWESVSSDDVRHELIEITKVFNLSNLLHEKSAYEGAIKLALLKRYKDMAVVCTRVSIGEIGMVYKV